MNFREYRTALNQALVMVNPEDIDNVIFFLREFSETVYLIGNGGSLSLANHFAQDLSKKHNISAIALTDPSTISAYANDINFESVFVRQVDSHVTGQDCLVAFSSSGNSRNIYLACERAKRYNAKVISFTGFLGGCIRGISDIGIYVPSNDYGIIETAHSLIFHYILENIEHA